MGHFLKPDETSEIEPFEPESIIYTGSTAEGTTSMMGRRAKQNPTIVSSTESGNNNGQSTSRTSENKKLTKPKQKTRDSDCCSINFIKYSLHTFNTIFLISGLVIIGVTLWTIFWKHQYISLLSTTNYVIGTYALLAAGLLAVFGGILGCCGVWHEQRGVLVLYTFVLLVVFLLEFIVGGLAYLYETQIETELQYTLNATFMEHYGVSEQQTKAIDSLQQEFSCCGAIRFEDWRHSVWLRSRRKDLIKPTEGRLVPDSCCITVLAKCGLRDGPSNIHYTGCIYEMTDDLKYHLIILGAIGLGLSVIQVFGMVLACCLYVKLKDVLD
ncbi:CD151 antigen-like [Anopheles moucheti]|uniref:CD151 antigen-like n=1 Tax=Anopheles moucheti TaxID=186751 RepID=UPI0022F11E18|nr:CD151 antigen-like [Anopheles moucheti]XP_052888306.1 CD151 antigen-like [Anopheles moucheti]XP_052888307.1 CD151 antigen-like [Anopheles moucheti]